MTGIKRNSKGQLVKGTRPANPHGRPKVRPDIKNLCRERAPAAIEQVFELAMNAKGEATRLKACEYLLDRAYGKPAPQTQEIDEIDKMSVEDLLGMVKQMAEQYDKLRNAKPILDAQREDDDGKPETNE